MFSNSVDFFSRAGRLFLFIGFCLWCIAAHSQKNKQEKAIKYKTTESGLKYAISQKNKKGQAVQPQDMVQVLYSSYLEDGTFIASSSDAERPLEFVAKNGEVLPGWEEAVSMLRVGEKGSFILPPHLAYGDKKFGKIPASATIRLELELIGVYPAFFNPKSEDFKTTPTGLQYAILNQTPNTDKVKPGNYVCIEYTGYIIGADGKRKIFDSSRKNKAISVVQCGVKKFISGLDEGILKMAVGDSATFIIPPSIGYGAKANQLVPAHSTIGFDVFLVRQIDPFFPVEELTYINHPQGFTYSFRRDLEGPTIKMNDNVAVHFVGYYLMPNGIKNIFESTIEKGEPQVFRVGRGIENPAWLTILQMCNVGDQVKMIIPPENARMELKKLIPENVSVFFELEIVAVAPSSFLETHADSDTLHLEEGLQLVSCVKGEGVRVDTNHAVYVHYTGYTIDSLGNKNVFDSSFDRKLPFLAELGKRKMIKGWEIGLPHTREGDQVRLVVPAQLGYGNKGMPPLILPNETLFFDMYVIKVLSVKEGSFAD